MAMNRRAAVASKLLKQAGYTGDLTRLAESLPPQTIAQFDKLLNHKEPSVGPGMDSGIVVAYKSGEVVQDRPMQGNFSKEGIAVYEDGGAVERLITRDPRVEYPTVLPFGVLTEPDPAGSLLSEQRTVLAMPELVRGTLEGVKYLDMVRRGQLDPKNATPEQSLAMLGAIPAGGLLFGRAPAGALGMNVFQGSPHRYGPEGAAKSLDHIGKGEGALAYGYGRYDAGLEKVGKKYRRDLNRGPAEVFVDGRAVTDFDTKTLNDPQSVGLSLVESMQRLRPHLSQDEIIDAAIKQGDTYIETYSLPGATADDLATADGWRRGRDWILKNKSRLSSAEGGYLYKHDIPDEDIARYLDWDKPLSEQPESVRKALEPLGFKADPQGLRDYDEALLDALYNDPKKALPKLPADPTGAEIYQSLVDKSGALDWPVGSDRAAREAYRKSAKQAASEALGKAGIPGLKYYDGMSRNAGEGTRNYVTWDQDVLDRMKLLQRNDERFAEGGAVEPRSADSEAEILAIYDLLDEENQKPERERDPERINELYSRLTELQAMSPPPVALELSDDFYLRPQLDSRFGIGESNRRVPFFEDTVTIRDRNMGGIARLGAEIGFPGFSGNDRLSGGVTGTYYRTKRRLPDEYVAFGAPSDISFGTRGVIPVGYDVNYSSGRHTFSGNVTPRQEGVSRDAPGDRSVLGLGYTYSTPEASYSLQAIPFGRREDPDPETGAAKVDRSIMGRYTTRF